MAKKLIMVSPVLVCAAVITALVLSGVGGAGQQATPAELEQAKANIVSLIEAGDMAGADAVLDGLLALADSEAKGQMLQQIAGVYGGAKQHSKAILLAEYVLEKWPGADYAVWCQMEVVLCNIALGNNTAAQAAVDKLSADYASDANLPWTTYILAEKYRWMKRYEQAKALYQRIIDEHPQSEWSSKAHLGIARAEILGLLESKSYWVAEQEVKRLVADFLGDAELPGTLRDIAERYRWVKKYDEAEELFKLADELEAGAGEEQPEPDVRAQCATILSLLQRGKTDEGFEAIDGLIADCGGDAKVSEGLYWIAKEREWVLGLDDANGIYERMLRHFPDGPQATRARLGIQRVKVGGLIESGDLSAAEVGLDALVADFNEHSDLRESLYWMAKRYEGQDAWEQAKGIYRQIMEGWPGSDEAKKSKLDIRAVDVFALIRGERHDEVAGAIDELIGDFEGDAYLPYIVWITGEEYYYEPALELRQEPQLEKAKEYFSRAIVIFDKAIEHLAGSAELVYAHYYAAECHRYLREYDEGAFHYQVVVNQWPEFMYVVSAEYLTGMCYEGLKRAGDLPQWEADELIEQAYLAVIENYSDDRWAANACIKLGKFYSEKQLWTESEQYYRMFLDIAEPNDYRVERVEAELEKIDAMK